MGVIAEQQSLAAIRVHADTDVWWITLDRPDAGNTINRALIEETSRALERCAREAKIVILEGSPDVFCLGADFREIHQNRNSPPAEVRPDAELLYELWRRLACGPHISVAHVRGRVNAGGVGFVAACDLVISDDRATFALSELLFGLLPACVMPFLIRRVGAARANYMALTTQAITSGQAKEWGLVDLCGERSEEVLRKQLLRLRRLEKRAIAGFKRYVGELSGGIEQAGPCAVRANLEAFSDPRNLDNISRYAATGRFPWE